MRAANLSAAVPQPTPLAHSGTSGTVTYVVVGGWCYVDVSMGFASTAAGGTFIAVTAANGLPDGVRPSSAKSGMATLATTIGRVVVNADGSVVIVPLTGAMTGAVGFAAFPAGV